MKEYLLKEISMKFYEFIKKFGFSQPKIQSNSNSSKIYYLFNKHALQIEIDWREYQLYMYIVYLKNEKLPPNGIIYSYKDGHWCRKYVEEIFLIHPHTCSCTKKHNPEQILYDTLQFYIDIINNNSVKLLDVFGKMNNI